MHWPPGPPDTEREREKEREREEEYPQGRTERRDWAATECHSNVILSLRVFGHHAPLPCMMLYEALIHMLSHSHSPEFVPLNFLGRKSMKIARRDLK